MQKVPLNNGKSLLVVLVDPLIDLAMIVDSLQQRLNLVLHIILEGLQTSLFLKEAQSLRLVLRYKTGLEEFQLSCQLELEMREHGRSLGKGRVQLLNIVSRLV